MQAAQKAPGSPLAPLEGPWDLLNEFLDGISIYILISFSFKSTIVSLRALDGFQLEFGGVDELL